MRIFPRTARRRLLTACAVGSLAVGALALPQAFANDGKDLKHQQQ